MTRRGFVGTLTAALGALAFWRKASPAPEPEDWIREYEPAFPEQHVVTLPEPITGVMKLEGRPYWMTEHGIWTVNDRGRAINIGSNR
jgi:hypothetical protein